MRHLRWIAAQRRLAAALTLAVIAAPRAAAAQAVSRVIVRVTADSTPIPGAIIASGTANTSTDRSGIATFNFLPGPHTFHVLSAGFRPESVAVNVSGGMTQVTIALHHQSWAASSIVGARRADRARTMEPTSIEVADRADLDDQVERSPATVDGALARMDGIRVQPLSAGSAGDAIRIRGMPGRYTKILVDGLPVFGATPEGLEPLQTSALGLDRIEAIEGVASALYGPTALAGVVNMVSAGPASPSEIVANGTSRGASDVALWQTHTFTPKWSATLLAGRHFADAADPDHDGWAEVDGYRQVVVRPRVFWARSPQSTWFMTGGWTSEDRTSGTFQGARLPDFNTYRDDANTRRADAGTVGRVLLDSNTYLTIRGSLTREWQNRWFGDDAERHRRNTIFGDVALTKTAGDNVLVGGMAFERDQYAALDTRGYSYRYTTPALFGEHTWTPAGWIGVTSAARLDLQSEFGDFLSPRMSVVVRPSDTWTARISATSGVYAPTPLTDDTEGFGLAAIRPTSHEAEHATGWTLDVDHVSGSLDLRGSAYRTIVNHPLIMRIAAGSTDELQLVNADEPSRTQGIDLSARYRVQPLRFTATYAYTDAVRPEIGQFIGEDFQFDTTMHRAVALDPRHSVRLDVAHERENDRLVGVEVAFTGRQTLSDSLATMTRSYVTLGARLEKHVGQAIIFVNGRNLTGVHQSQYSPVLMRASGLAGQWTNDPWAPLDGRVFNAGLRVSY